MQTRNLIYLIVFGLVNTFFFYYIITFCGIYVATSMGWLMSSILCLIFKWGIAETLGPLLGGLVRRYYDRFE
jgi:hypothetical protein